MGLIDEVRKKKDPWTKRYEEQRQDDYGSDDDDGKKDEEMIRQLDETRKRIGFFNDQGKK